MANRRRLDAELVRRALAPSREAAKRLIEGGRITVGGAPAHKPASQVDPGIDIRLVGEPPRYVSRAGEKLEAALAAFPVDPTGRHCLDVGSSTGGFTDCLLQHGAASVIAVDVGTHQLHERIRTDQRVTVMEQTDIRRLDPARIPTPIDVAVADVSFISLSLVLPSIVAFDPSDVVALVKPQFEAGRRDVSRGGGVVTDPAIWSAVLLGIADAVHDLHWVVEGVIVSPITGRAGNVEFVTHLRPGARADAASGPPFEEQVQAVIAAASRPKDEQ